ncbi:hypothetical protein SY27_16855 [Flavobacterium sp. 316]|uniref:Uncharacterized protein n=1 Tax=Flavobacterium sediminilitoris TaxID=2024526 RepID=A0ABY4HMP3_9FLAO|nr:MULTISPECIES: hypothetical protein [Flavobacterium]KIX19731.1 hypothetical protein SY27_16855 [Flavobacterium sp. 316]UOX33955.1 hypothetical protein LXD69_00215 [Flavobacterium sediminilitoris]
MQIFNSPRLRERKEGFDMLNELLKDKVKCYIIHYSCESFITNHGRTPRVTSICMRNLKTAQTKSFSIHLQAQLNGLDFNNLTDTEYDSLEKVMLNEFSAFVRSYPAHRWIHWNMRDSNYGFEAINNRIRILNGQTFEIADDFKYDFPIILGHIYTYGYEKNQPKGRFLNLAERNFITTQNAMTGADEAAAFDNKEYLKLHMSTLKKVDILASIIHRVENDELKVNIKRKYIYGLTLPGCIALIKETPWLLILAGIIGYLIGAALEPVVQNICGTA